MKISLAAATAAVMGFVVPATAGNVTHHTLTPITRSAPPLAAAPQVNLQQQGQKYWQGLSSESAQQEAIIRRYWKPCSSIMC
jgi:hypothetical protein